MLHEGVAYAGFSGVWRIAGITLLRELAVCGGPVMQLSPPVMGPVTCFRIPVCYFRC